jgi:hypothetical protein
MSEYGLAKTYAAVVGVVLVLVGLLGFISNPIVGEPTANNNPIFVTDAVHNVVHIASGLLLLYIAFATSGVTRANWLIGFGVLYVGVLVLTLINPELFGIFQNPVNTADHVLHAALAFLSIGVGYMARNETETVARTR